MKKKVAVIFTGGTISMKVDSRLGAAIPLLTNEEIISMVTNIEKHAIIETINFARLPGPHITPEIMLELSKLITILIQRNDIDGVVVTHGTDTLEETAYFLDLTINCTKPVIVVGAMRNGSELGYDGPSNLAAAICTSICSDSCGKGVLVVMNDEVNAASEVTKTNTLSLNTFQSPQFGPLGIVDNDEVLFYRTIKNEPKLNVKNINARVALLKCASGMSSDILEFCINAGYNGIVIEALGRGNVPIGMVSGIKKAIDNDLAIVIVSRCYAGRVLDTYGYSGAGRELKEYGAIFGDNLPGQKARIKLLLALSTYDNIEDVKKVFEYRL
ncbi:asparaginase [Clostridiaceae bacterium M8S5]|nr:asparaginase [Clostridiaceae bacterium M8S5]